MTILVVGLGDDVLSTPSHAPHSDVSLRLEYIEPTFLSHPAIHLDEKFLRQDCHKPDGLEAVRTTWHDFGDRVSGAIIRPSCYEVSTAAMSKSKKGLLALQEGVVRFGPSQNAELVFACLSWRLSYGASVCVFVE